MARTRIGLALATAAMGVAGVLGLAACAPAEAALTTEGQALATMGFDTQDLAAEPTGAAEAPAADPSAKPATGADKPTGDRREKYQAARRVVVNRHVLHGEVTVDTKQGPKVVVIQRGTVTELSPTSITVKSTDGFTQTWVLNKDTHVVHAKNPVTLSDVKNGIEIGIAGTKDGSTLTARLIVIPDQK